MNIKWMDRITNEEVLGRIGERRTLWKSLRKRRGQMMGHTLRHGGLLRDILEREVRKKGGRPKLKYFDQIIGNMRCEGSNNWRGTESSGDGWLRQTSLRTVCSQ